MWLGTLRLRHEPFASMTGPRAWTRKDVEDILFLGVVGVVLGGRLGYCLFYKPGYYASHPLEIFAIWQGGMSFHGGLLGVIGSSRCCTTSTTTVHRRCRQQRPRQRPATPGAGR